MDHILVLVGLCSRILGYFILIPPVILVTPSLQWQNQEEDVLEQKLFRKEDFELLLYCKQYKDVLLNLDWTINTLIIFLSKAKG